MTDFDDPACGKLSGPGFDIEILIAQETQLKGFAFHVRSGVDAIYVVADILTHLGLRALCPDSESGLFDVELNAIGAFGRWRAYRERMVQDSS